MEIPSSKPTNPSGFSSDTQNNPGKGKTSDSRDVTIAEGAQLPVPANKEKEKEGIPTTSISSAVKQQIPTQPIKLDLMGKNFDSIEDLINALPKDNSLTNLILFKTTIAGNPINDTHLAKVLNHLKQTDSQLQALHIGHSALLKESNTGLTLQGIEFPASLKVLNMKNVKSSSDKGFSQAIQGCTQLTTLDVSNNSQLSFGENLRLPASLENLIADECPLLVDANLSLALQDCRQLKTASFKNNKNLTFAPGLRFAPTLEELNIYKTSATDAGLATALGGNMSLTSLEASYTPLTLHNIHYPGTLTSIKLSYCPNLTGEGLATALKECKQLQTAELGDCAALSFVEGFKFSATLQSIDVPRCPGIKNTPFVEAIKNCSQLKSLNLSETSISLEGLDSLPATLTEFYMAKCPLKDDAFIKLTTSCTEALEFVGVENTEVTQKSLDDLQKRLPELMFM